MPFIPTPLEHLILTPKYTTHSTFTTDSAVRQTSRSQPVNVPKSKQGITIRQTIRIRKASATRIPVASQESNYTKSAEHHRGLHLVWMTGGKRVRLWRGGKYYRGKRKGGKKGLEGKVFSVKHDLECGKSKNLVFLIYLNIKFKKNLLNSFPQKK